MLRRVIFRGYRAPTLVQRTGSIERPEALPTMQLADVIDHVTSVAAEHPATAHREPPILPERAQVIAGLVLRDKGDLPREVIDLRWRIVNATGMFEDIPTSIDPEYRPDNILYNAILKAGLPAAPPNELAG